MVPFFSDSETAFSASLSISSFQSLKFLILGSNIFRPSTMMGLAMSSLVRARSSARNSSHSVTTRSAFASSFGSRMAQLQRTIKKYESPQSLVKNREPKNPFFCIDSIIWMKSVFIVMSSIFIY